jgi:uncharacterized protein YacL
VPRRATFKGSAVFVPITRFAFFVLGGVAGYEVAQLNQRTQVIPVPDGAWEIIAITLMTLAGALLGYFVGWLLAAAVVRLVAGLDDVLARHNGLELLIIFVGLVVGLGIAALLSLGVSRVPVVGVYLNIPVFLVCAYVTAYVAQRKANDILRLFGVKTRIQVAGGPGAKVLDSSALIDGRVIDVVKTGFIEGDLLIPRFVLEELQRVADSSDPEKRVRGRRGLDYVQKLQDMSKKVQVLDTDYTDLSEVDAKLVRLATSMPAAIVTTDFNLNKVARIQKVQVLNVNELANAVKSPVLPGEEIEVKILREGREHHQGVGYLDDGTMIVVEDGREMVGATVKAEVTSVLQSPSGKMIFARTSK